MQPCKTGDQPYSDTSPYSECSLVLGLIKLEMSLALRTALRTAFIKKEKILDYYREPCHKQILD